MAYRPLADEIRPKNLDEVGGQRENALQNGPSFNQAAGAGLAFLVALLVLQNLLAVLKLPDLLQDFLPFFF